MKKFFLLVVCAFVVFSCNQEKEIQDDVQIVRDTIDTMYAAAETHDEVNLNALQNLLPKANDILNKYSVKELSGENREIFQNLSLEFISASIIFEDAGYYISDFVKPE